MHNLQSTLTFHIQHIKYLYQIKNTYVVNHFDTTLCINISFFYHIVDTHIPLLTLDVDVLEEIRHLYQDIESIIQNNKFKSIFVLFLCKHSIASHLNIHRFLWTSFCLKDVRRRKIHRVQPFPQTTKFNSLTV